MGEHPKEIAKLMRQSLMGYFRECQTTGVLPDINEAWPCENEGLKIA